MSNNNISIKLTCMGEIRRLSVAGDGDGLTFLKVLELAKRLFKQQISEKEICFKYIDPEEEGQMITLRLDEELSEAVRLFSAAGKPLTLEVVVEDGDDHHPNTAVHPVAIHGNVTCDECGQGPIVGDRFKCCVREDFDLCAACEAKQQQPFAMIKIANPQQAPAALIVGLREDPQPSTQPQQPAAGGGRQPPGRGAFREGPRGPWGGHRGFHHPPPPPMAAPGADGVPPHHPFPFAPRGLGGGWRGCAPPMMAHAHPEHLPPALQARFVKDETLPDGSAVPMGTTVDKVWVVRNDGASDWPAGVKLVYVSGDEMAVELPADIRCSPGQEVRLVASLKSPPMTGRFVSYFRLHGPAGHPFGQRLWCDIRSVEQVPVPEPRPVAAPVAEAEGGDYVRVDGIDAPTATATAAPAAPAAPAPAPAPGPAGTGSFEREMAVLRELGFVNDSNQLGGLLQDLLSTPDERVAGLQRFVATLLHAAATPSA